MPALSVTVKRRVKVSSAEEEISVSSELAAEKVMVPVPDSLVQAQVAMPEVASEVVAPWETRASTSSSLPALTVGATVSISMDSLAR